MPYHVRILLLVAITPLLFAATADRIQQNAGGMTPMELLDKNRAAGAQVYPGELLVVVDDLDREALAEGVDRHGCQIDHRLGARPVYSVACDEQTETEVLVDRLWHTDGIEWVEANYLVRVEGEPDDLISEQWHHKNEGQEVDGVAGDPGSDINSPEAWQIHTGSPEVVIAPIDFGLYAEHEDLEDRIWQNDDESCESGTDDDGNGYVDDCRGWDTADDDNDPDPTDLPDEKPDDQGNCAKGHGTLMAGLTGATGDNGLGGVGVGWDFTLMDLKYAGDEDCFPTTGHAFEAAAYAIDNGADVLVMSFTTEAESPTHESILQSGDRDGVITVMSAGNGGEDSDEIERYPNDYDIENRLVAANTTNSDELASGSNWGSENVDLGAPGTDLYGPGLADIDHYRLGTGTSYSGPLVAGAVGLVRAAFPDLAAEDVVAAIRDGVHPLPNLDCEQTDQCVATGGRLDVYGALREAASRAGPARLVHRTHVVSAGPGAEADGRHEPDELIEIHLELANIGGDADGGLARVEPTSDSASRDLNFLQDEVDIGEALGGTERVVPDEPFYLQVDDECAGAVEADLAFEITADGGESTTHEFSIELACDVDYDGDGYARPEDCDDNDPDVHPGAEEVCDGRDTNCDGVADEDAVDRQTWYRDEDDDGYGTDDEVRVACNQPAGFADNDEDCDDDNADAYPGSSSHDEDCEPRYQLTENEDSGCSTGGRPGATGWLLLIGLASVGLRRMHRRNSFS